MHAGFTFVVVPESIRFELRGQLRAGVTAKDVMLHILATHARSQATLDRVMEFGGPGLSSLSPDERATLCNMATECAAKAGICEVDAQTVEWIAMRRPGTSTEALLKKAVTPDPGAEYAGGIHVIDLSGIRPMVATPGDASRGIPSDPTNGALIEELGEVPIEIAYGGSCTAGKEVDMDLYAEVCAEAVAEGRKVKDGVDFYIQFGSKAVESYARQKGYVAVFEQAGVRLIPPGCGACIGCGPGVSSSASTGVDLGHQPQLRGPLGPRSAVPCLAVLGRRVRGRGQDRLVQEGHVRGGHRQSTVDSRQSEPSRKPAP